MESTVPRSNMSPKLGVSGALILFLMFNIFKFPYLLIYLNSFTIYLIYHHLIFHDIFKVQYHLFLMDIEVKRQL